MSQANAPQTLDLTLPLDGVQLIEASAGTGKTFTIAGLYLRLIVERGLTPARILVMTFTRVATNELRQRLRERLQLALDLAESLRAGGAPLPAVWQDRTETQTAQRVFARHLATASEDIDALTRRLRAALQSMDEAAIFTIHGFCQRVLGDFAGWLDAAPTDAVLTPSDLDLIDDYASDFWLRVAGSGQPLATAALQSLAGSPAQLARTLQDLVDFDGRVELSPAPSPIADDTHLLAQRDAARESLLSTWQDTGAAAVDTLRTQYARGGLNGNTYRKESFGRRLDGLVHALRSGRVPDEALLHYFSADKIRAARKKSSQDFEVPPLFAVIDRWLECSTAIDGAQNSHRTRLALSAHTELAAHLAARKRALARHSHADLIARVAGGIDGDNGAALASALFQRYPVAMLDEFQDTDARQYGIFARIYANRGSLFLVGDPKQAIYSFRGGDLDAYLRVARRLDTSQRHSLKQNFRSSPAMLQAVAALFTQVPAPFLDPAIRFESIQPGGVVDDGALRVAGNPVAPLTLWPLPSDGGNKDALTAHYADACAATIARLLAAGRLRDPKGGEDLPLQHQRIAVLTNNNEEILAVQAALARHHIAAACVRQQSLYASREASELLRLLDALLAPQSMIQARGALATRLLGRRLSDFAAMTRDDSTWRSALDELADLRRRWLERGILAMIMRLGEQHAARILAQDEGERVLGNLLQLGEALQVDARSLAGEQALRDRLQQRIEDADDHNEEEQLQLESDAKRVQILTVHRSKGLEFDVVLLPFACRMQTHDARSGRILDFHRDEARIKHWLLANKDERGAADQLAIAAAEREQLAERLRCFYVGVTRAVHACWLSSGGGEVLEHLLPDDSSGQALATRCAHIVTAAAPTTAPALRPPPPSAFAVTRTFDAVIRRDWHRHSFSRLTRGSHALGGGRRDEPEPGAAASGTTEVIDAPAGSRFGTAVHAILETTEFAAWRGRHDAPPSASALLERELRAQGFAGGAVAATAKLIARSLNAEILPGLRLVDLPPAARRAEMEFDFGIAGVATQTLLRALHQAGYQRHRDGFAGDPPRLRGLMNGIIDLVFQHQGRWYIVDYKTNRLGRHAADYAPAALRQAIAANDYDLQYLIYTVALHRWLRRNLGPMWDYARDFGGVLYLFLRGLDSGVTAGGIHFDRPAPALIEALDHALNWDNTP
ncbi:MAG TPA: UvrD-helicase domain-containing protein [Rhodanobacteraceae bacterium]|nr:UvrD-helicase domain-containing protein [Rhodanobacteraceae bacterium]